MLESRLEQLFFNQVRAAGGIAIKLMPTHPGIPDRLVLWPGGRSALVELKQETGTLSEVQKVWHQRARNIGHPVVTLYGANAVREWIRANA